MTSVSVRPEVTVDAQPLSSVCPSPGAVHSDWLPRLGDSMSRAALWAGAFGPPPSPRSRNGQWGERETGRGRKRWRTVSAGRFITGRQGDTEAGNHVCGF